MALLFDDPIVEYNIRWLLDADVSEEVVRLKQLLRERYGYQSNINSIPHITLANFLAANDVHAGIVNGMRDLYTARDCIFKNVGIQSFKHSNALVIRLENITSLEELVSRMKRELPIKLKSKNLTTVYHITLCKFKDYEACLEAEKYITEEAHLPGSIRVNVGSVVCRSSPGRWEREDAW